jgi:uncharacterized membrane protein
LDIFRLFRLQAQADRAPGGLYERLRDYPGSPQYQAMLAANGGVAPGGGGPLSPEERKLLRKALRRWSHSSHTGFRWYGYRWCRYYR